MNAAYEPVVTLLLTGPEGRSLEIDTVVDTGFNGFLTIPTALAADLGLAFEGIGRATLADGSVAAFDVYVVTVLWDGIARSVSAGAVDGAPLLGMSMLTGHELRVQVREGGRVLIHAALGR